MGVECSYNGNHETILEGSRAEDQVKVSMNVAASPLVCSFRIWIIGFCYLLRNKSPDLLRNKSPDLLRNESPDLPRNKSPDLLRNKSPDLLRNKSPDLLRNKSPDLLL
jgi:hypothetical protein